MNAAAGSTAGPLVTSPGAGPLGGAAAGPLVSGAGANPGEGDSPARAGTLVTGAGAGPVAGPLVTGAAGPGEPPRVGEPRPGHVRQWAAHQPRALVGLLITGACLMAVFGFGGLAWMVEHGPSFLGGRMTSPPLWAFVSVIAALVATSVAFAVWHWDRPLSFLIVASGFQLVWTLILQVHQPAVGFGAWVYLWLAIYYVTLRRGAAWAWTGLGANLAVFALVLAAFQPPRWTGLLLLAAGLNLAAGSFTILRGTRSHYIDALLERNRLLAAQRDQRAELAVTAERNGIAREMHDIVSHSLAVMVTLSDGAARLVETEPEEARRALTEIAATGRHAVNDVRRLIQFLRSDADLRPQPSLNDLGDLVASHHQLGLPVTVELTTALPADPAFGLTVYRIVQEALTNVLRHAPTSPEVSVTIAQTTPGVIDVIVDNAPGLNSEGGAGPGAGHGLVGMRQRTEIWHGGLESGPRPDGGWRVHARLTWDDEVD